MIVGTQILAFQFFSMKTFLVNYSLSCVSNSKAGAKRKIAGQESKTCSFVDNLSLSLNCELKLKQDESTIESTQRPKYRLQLDEDSEITVSIVALLSRQNKQTNKQTKLQHINLTTWLIDSSSYLAFGLLWTHEYIPLENSYSKYTLCKAIQSIRDEETQLVPKVRPTKPSKDKFGVELLSIIYIVVSLHGLVFAWAQT